MSNVSLKKFKLSTGFCFISIPDINRVKIPKVEPVKAYVFAVLVDSGAPHRELR